ncbi:carbohydrate-binding protein [Paractinoplanes ferrugineus]|nr:carbohydrate-binding protein [Actinoplanes ferrugineus]
MPAETPEFVRVADPRPAEVPLGPSAGVARRTDVPARPMDRRVLVAGAVVAVAAIVAVLALNGPDRPEAGPSTNSITGDWLPPGAPGLLLPSAAPSPAVAPSAGVVPPAGAVPDSYISVSAPAAQPAGRARPGSAPAKPPGTTKPAENATAYSVIQAERFDEQNGVEIQADESGPGIHVGFITTGDWVRYDDIGFTDVPATKLLISAANWAAAGGTGEVELRLDDRSEAPIGRLTIPNNGNWFAFTTYVMTIRPTTGVHTVYLTFTSKQKEEFGNIDWFRFQH